MVGVSVYIIQRQLLGMRRLTSIIKRNAAGTDSDWYKGSIVYADNHLLVVNKPPGVPTQGDSSNDDNLLDLAKSYIAKKFNKPGDVYLGLVHRLDRPCSGVVVFARTSKAANRLCKAFAQRETDKSYLCVVNGHLLRPGQCRNYIIVGGTGNDSNKVRVTAEATTEIAGARSLEAHLAYNPIISFKIADGTFQSVSAQAASTGIVYTLVRIDLYTGRKHQIRAQLAHLGYPVCGDVKYGAPPWPPAVLSTGRSQRAVEKQGSYNGILLHAHSLSLAHPTTKLQVKFTAPLPQFWKLCLGSSAFSALENVIKGKMS